jgi:hypothetical protein
MRGFLIPDPRLGCDGLAANDATATGSDYQQAGPKPGTSTTTDTKSRLVSIVRGGQTQDLELQITQAGDPGFNGARARWRFAGETDDDWRGHNSPALSDHWFPVVWDSSGTTEAGTDGAFDAVTDPTSQRVGVVFRDLSLSQKIRFARSVGVDRFEIVGDIGGGLGNIDAALTILPSGRVLARGAGQLFYSDDAFSAVSPTWAVYAASPFADPDGLAGLPVGWVGDHVRMKADANGNVIAIQADDYTTTGGNADGAVVVFVSSNQGATFEAREAVALGNGTPADVSIALLPSGAIVVGYLRQNGAFVEPCARVLGSAFDSLESAPEIVIEELTDHSVFSLWADERGAVFVASGSSSTLKLYRSTDGGNTWEILRWGPWKSTFPTSTGVGLTSIAAVSTRGGAWLIHQGTGAAGFEDDSIGCLRAGGWNGLEIYGIDPFAAAAPSFQKTGGWRDNDNTSNNEAWIPFQLPDAGSGTWAAFGATAGTITATGEMKINPAAADGGYRRTHANGADVILYASLSAQANGGSLTSAQHAIEVITTDGAGTTAGHAQIRFETTAAGIAFVVHDVIAGIDRYTTPAPIPAKQTTGSEPFLEVWYYQRGAGPQFDLGYRMTTETRIVREPTRTLTGGAVPAAGASIAVGSLVASTTDQLWRALHVNDKSDDLRMADVQALGISTDDQLGAELNAEPFALSLVGRLDETEGRISLRGSPARLAELQTCPTAYDFPVASAFWDCAPSRREVWRSTDETQEQILAFAFDEQTRIGGSFILGLFVAGANFAEAVLEIDTTGAGAWSIAGTLDLTNGFQALGFERYGDTIRPGASPINQGDRFLNRAEMVGGVCRWGSGGTAGVARIETQSAGGWTDKATNTIQPFIRVDASSVAGTATTGNDLSIQAPAGLLLVSLSEVAGLVYGVRVRIPAATTPEGYHEAGIIMIGAFNAFGQQYSRGYSVETSPNVTRTTSTAGTIRKTQQGDNATRFSFAWPDGVKLAQMRGGIAPDYLGPAGKPPVVADSDVWGQLWGMLDETRGGSVPVVVVTKPPAMGQTLTDRTLFAFATIDGSARFDHVLGDEGENEFGRVAGVEAVEIR